MKSWWWLLVIAPGGSLIVTGLLLYGVWKRRQSDQVSAHYLREQRQREGYEFEREHW